MALETGTYISDLVATNPVGTDDRSTADDHIRLLKSTIKTTFPNITGAMTSTHTQLSYLASTTGVAGGGTKIDMFVSGTPLLCQQTTAPTGWTKSTTHNNKALRVVSGTASSGGTKSFTTTFGSGKATDGHTLIAAEIPAHDHGSVGGHTHTLPVYDTTNSGTGVHSAPRSSSGATGQRSTGSAGGHTHASFGGSGAHSHNLSNFDLQYVDLIIITKDA